MRLGAKRYISIRREKQKSVARWLALLGVFALVVGAVWYGVCVMRPAFCALAESRARELAVVAIHEAIAEKFSQEEYKDVVQLERDADSRVGAVRSDMARFSKLKSELNLEIQKTISSLDKSTLSVPLGSLTGSELFYGMGPDISFEVKPYGTVLCDLATEFTEAGINQTMCDVAVSVKTELAVLMPTLQRKSVVETSVPVAQTIIVGDVPQSFTHVDREGKEFEDDVLQLAE